MMKEKELSIPLVDEQATVAMGTLLAKLVQNQLKQGVVVYLSGDLGAGKTTLTRGFVQGMGHQGKVKSPTYTLVEPYEFEHWQVYHFDLYRLADPEELEFMGIRDYFHDASCCFIEWPQKGQGMLEKADLMLHLEYSDLQREITLTASSEKGRKLITYVQQACQE